MIEFKNVTKIYDKSFPALEDLSLQIADGEFVFVVGPSESGKSSIFRLLTRMEKPTLGTITVGDLDLGKMKRKKVPYYRRKLGIIFQDPRLFSEQTVFDNIALALRITGAHSADVRTKSHTALKMVELGDVAKKTPAQLSAFDQQRVALARALAGGSGIIIADEPTGNLNPIQAKEFIELLMRIHSRFKKTVLVFTNGKEFIEEFGQRIVFLSSGVVEEDRPAVQPLITESEEEEISSEEFAATYENLPHTEGADQSTVIFTAMDADHPLVLTEDTVQFDAVKPLTEDTVQFDAVKPLTEDTMQFDAVKPLTEDTVQFDAVKPLTENTVQFDAVKPLTENTVQFDAVKLLTEDTVQFDVVKPAMEDAAEFEAVISETEESVVEDTLVNLSIVTVPDAETVSEEDTEAAVPTMADAEPADIPEEETDSDPGENAHKDHTVAVDPRQSADDELLSKVKEFLELAEPIPSEDAPAPVAHRVFNDLQVAADWDHSEQTADDQNQSGELIEKTSPAVWTAEEGQQ